jgi:hypothetical protein
MSSVIIAGDTSGTVTLQAPAVSGSTVITLPSTSMTLGPAYTGLSTVVFTSSGTFTVPAGITQATITVVGGGGGGGATLQGGTGGYAKVYITGLSGSYTVTVGAGGNGGASGTAGGTSSFGSLISCTGGAVGGANGVGTVSSGTAINTGSMSNAYSNTGNVTLNEFGKEIVNFNGTTTGVTWTVGSVVAPGSGGFYSATAASRNSGISGIIIIQY